MAHLFVLGLLASGEEFAGAIQQLPHPLADLDRVDSVIGIGLLDRLAAADRLHGGPGLELWVRHLLIGESPPNQGRYPVSAVNDGS